MFKKSKIKKLEQRLAGLVEVKEFIESVDDDTDSDALSTLKFSKLYTAHMCIGEIKHQLLRLKGLNL